MYKEFSFDRIYVIESLPDEEQQTGTDIYNDLLKRLSEKYEALTTELIVVANNSQWVLALQKIIEECRSRDIWPFIHFEIHGSEDKQGLVLKSNEVIAWKDLVQQLRVINSACKHNLVISLATCFGAYLFRAISPLEPRPVWGFIGPWQPVNTGHIETGFTSFFDTFIDTLDLNKSIEELNRNLPVTAHFKFYNAEEIFDAVWRVYASATADPENLKNRITELILQARANTPLLRGRSDSELETWLTENLMGNGMEEFRIRLKERFMGQL